MRASTLFAVTLSLLVGLGAAGGARYAGLFDKKDAPPPAAPAAAPKVLVAKTNLYEDVLVSADMVTVRDLRADEEAAYKADPGKYMVADVMTAHQRTTKKVIAAGTPLLKEYFNEPGLPDNVTQRLDPGTRSITLAVAKDKAAGGVLRPGEYVDVLVTSRVSLPGVPDTVRTACLAKNCKILMKRNSLWQFMGSDPDNQPVHFAVQANPYRAALLEYASTRGAVTLLPVPTPAKKVAGAPWSDPMSKEYADEDMRVDSITRGELAVGDVDLARVFNLTALPPPLAVRHIQGVTPAGSTVFAGGGDSFSAPSGAPPRQVLGAPPEQQVAGGSGFVFTPPNSGTPGCPTCGPKRQ